MQSPILHNVIKNLFDLALLICLDNVQRSDGTIDKSVNHISHTRGLILVQLHFQILFSKEFRLRRGPEKCLEYQDQIAGHFESQPDIHCSCSWSGQVKGCCKVGLPNVTLHRVSEPFNDVVFNEEDVLTGNIPHQRANMEHALKEICEHDGLGWIKRHRTCK